MSFVSVPKTLVFPKDDKGAGTYAARVAAVPTDAPRIVLVPEIHPLRAASEACIREVYARMFGAYDFDLPRLLLAWVAADELPLCAAGLRTASDGFLSETYLDGSVERALQRRTRQPVARDTVVEITTLASRSASASTRFVRHIARFGKQAGFAWSFFTATARLRRLLNDLGIPTFVLAEADAARIADPERWGSYYGHAPLVCAIKGDWVEERTARA